MKKMFDPFVRLILIWIFYLYFYLLDVKSRKGRVKRKTEVKLKNRKPFYRINCRTFLRIQSIRNNPPKVLQIRDTINLMQNYSNYGARGCTLHEVPESYSRSKRNEIKIVKNGLLLISKITRSWRRLGMEKKKTREKKTEEFGNFYGPRFSDRITRGTHT